MINKRGAEIAIGTIILIIISVIVLALVIAGFAMGWGTLTERIKSFFGPTAQSVDLAITSCMAKCTFTQEHYAYCCNKFDVKGLDPNKPKEVTKGITCYQLKHDFLKDGGLKDCDDSFCNDYPSCKETA